MPNFGLALLLNTRKALEISLVNLRKHGRNASACSEIMRESYVTAVH